MYVCPGLQLKYTGLGIVYIHFWHVILMVPWKTPRIEDDSRLENKSKDIEDGLPHPFRP